MEYYIYVDRQEGPFTLGQLQTKKISADTPVWHTGLAEWTTAGKVAELQHLLKAVPPPYQVAPVTEYEYQLQMEEFFTERKSYDWITVGWVFFSILCFLLLIWAMSR